MNDPITIKQAAAPVVVSNETRRIISQAHGRHGGEASMSEAGTDLYRRMLTLAAIRSYRHHSPTLHPVVGGEG